MNKNEQFVITINRELGSGGRTVGRLLAEKLGVPFYDKAVIKALQEKYTGTSRYDTRNYQLVIAADGKTEEEIADIIMLYIG